MRILAVFALAAAYAVPAQAGPASDALSKVAKCADIAGAAERLQCFDAAAADAKAVLAAPAAEAAAEETEGGMLSWFGLAREKPVTKAEDFGTRPSMRPVDPSAPREITEISAGVIEYAKNAYGRSLFVLDNGQVWKQIDGDTTELYVSKSDGPMKVTIEKAVFGSFMLSIEGRSQSLKVRRVK